MPGLRNIIGRIEAGAMIQPARTLSGSALALLGPDARAAAATAAAQSPFRKARVRKARFRKPMASSLVL
jgi:hypothetical protein